jgi:E1A/CREB-binding protein
LQLAEVFDAEIDGAMRSLGYCCGKKFVFSPQVLCCFGKQLCAIPRDTVYYNYRDRYVTRAIFAEYFKLSGVM